MGDVVSAVLSGGGDAADAEPVTVAPPKTMRRWAVNVAQWKPTQQQWMAAAGLIQLEEKERIGRFVFSIDAKLAMVGRLLIRRAVADVLGVKNTEIQLGRTKEKKPFLKCPRSADFPSFNFNVSHAGDYVVIASSPSHLIGVDVADIRKPMSETIDDFFRLMKGQFTPSEWKDINKPAEDLERLHMFYRHWSLKESYIKAVGVGLGLDLQRLEFSSDQSLTTSSNVCYGATLRIDGRLDTAWKFSQCYIDDEHCIAVALGPPEDAIPSYLSTLGIASTGVGTQAAGSPSTSKGSHSVEAQLDCPFEVLGVDDLIASAEPISSVEDEAYWEQFKLRKEKPPRR